MKYETIKDRMKRHIIQEFDSGAFDVSTHAIRLFLDSKPLEYYENKERARKACLELIDQWDVRVASSLFILFPSVYPSMVGKPLNINYADNGEWIVEKA